MNRIYQINISKGGVPKLPIQKAKILLNGIEGDIQKDKRYHGGSERALCLFSIELIEKLKAEGHPISAGSTGENITMSFKDYHLLAPNVKLKLGDEVVVQLTSYTAPCKTIKRSFLNEVFIRISNKVFPNQSRLYARILHEGEIEVGDEIIIVE